MTPALLKVLLFVVAIMVFFMFIGHVLTKISGEEGRIAALTSTGEISPEMGKSLFWGKGKCYTCHSIGTEGSGIRCPNLGVGGNFDSPIWVRAAERKPGMSEIDYFVESLYKPDEYVVEGFPKNLMRPIHRPPILLSADEIASVIVYLMSLGGEVADDKIRAIARAQEPYKGEAAEVAVAEPGLQLPEGNGRRGRRVFAKMQCFKCHEIEGEDFGQSPEEVAAGGFFVGPALTDIGAIQTKTYLAESVLNPNAVVITGEGFTTARGQSKMPSYDMLTMRELFDLVTYMTSLQGPPPPPPEGV